MKISYISVKGTYPALLLDCFNTSPLWIAIQKNGKWCTEGHEMKFVGFETN
ncbi:MAG: hypothetical protein U0V49_07715 [Saprospiraceae bacterium]